MDDARVRSLVQEELRASATGVLVRQLQAVLRWGDGVPSGDPGPPRAFYIDRTGAVGAIGYVWDGSAWTAFA